MRLNLIQAASHLFLVIILLFTPNQSNLKPLKCDQVYRCFKKNLQIYARRNFLQCYSAMDKTGETEFFEFREPRVPDLFSTDPSKIRPLSYTGLFIKSLLSSVGHFTNHIFLGKRFRIFRLKRTSPSLKGNVIEE